jgi:hypothetical protein
MIDLVSQKIQKIISEYGKIFFKMVSLCKRHEFSALLFYDFLVRFK